MNIGTTSGGSAPVGAPWRTLIGGLAMVGLLALASRAVPQLNTLLFAAVTALFAAPALLGSWHATTARRLVAMHPYRPGRTLHWWATRRLSGYLLGAALALPLAAAVVLQSVLFDHVDWALLAAAPLAFALVQRGAATLAQAQFNHPVYALAWALRCAHWISVTLLCAGWVAATLMRPAPPAVPVADAVYAWQQTWAQAPSAIVRWGLDLAAWGHTLADAALQQPDARTWRLALAAVLTPVSVFGFVALALRGLSLPAPELRRVLASPATIAPEPKALGAVAAAVWAAVLVVAAMALLHGAAQTEAWLGRHPASPIALVRVPACERIGTEVFKLGTVAQVKDLLRASNSRVQGASAAACTGLAGVDASAAKAVDDYLDWYFGLGAEWARVVQTLAGNIEPFLARRFEAIVFRDPALPALFADIAREQQRMLAEWAESGEQLRALMARNKLVLDERQCKVVDQLAPGTLAGRLGGDFEARLAGASGGALVAGALAAKFTAKVTAKAMGKASMTLAANVLAKALAKKAAGKLAGAAGGAATGAALGSALPGAGTVAGAVVGGAVVGGAVGLAFGTAIDLAMLAAEERLSRASFRAELLESLHEVVAEYRLLLGCR